LDYGGFGYDGSNDTYKAVAVSRGIQRNRIDLRVHFMGDNYWRKITSWPQYPCLLNFEGQLVNGNLDWIALLE